MKVNREEGGAGYIGTLFPIEQVIDMLSEAETVDCVVHGHWEKQTEYFGHSFKCSVCNECTIFTQDTPPKFCSKCGARLEGEQK